MRVAHVAPIRARCFNSKRTSFHVAIELEHMESVDLRSAIYAKRTQFCLYSRVQASAATHSSASRGAAGVVCCFESGCKTHPECLSAAFPTPPPERQFRGCLSEPKKGFGEPPLTRERARLGLAQASPNTLNTHDTQ